MVKKNKDIKLCVFCGSKKGFSSDYYKLANKLGKIIALNKVNLVYGGGDNGLMGAIAKSVMDNGGDVLGILPIFFPKPTFQSQLFKLIVVNSMSERKDKFIEISDAFCIFRHPALPQTPGRQPPIRRKATSIRELDADRVPL